MSLKEFRKQCVLRCASNKDVVLYNKDLDMEFVYTILVNRGYNHVFKITTKDAYKYVKASNIGEKNA